MKSIGDYYDIPSERPDVRNEDIINAEVKTKIQEGGYRYKTPKNRRKSKSKTKTKSKSPSKSKKTKKSRRKSKY